MYGGAGTWDQMTFGSAVQCFYWYHFQHNFISHYGKTCTWEIWEIVVTQGCSSHNDIYQKCECITQHSICMWHRSLSLQFAIQILHGHVYNSHEIFLIIATGMVFPLSLNFSLFIFTCNNWGVVNQCLYSVVLFLVTVRTDHEGYQLSLPLHSAGYVRHLLTFVSSSCAVNESLEGEPGNEAHALKAASFPYWHWN